MKRILILLFLSQLVFSCTKQFDGFENELSFDMNGNHYFFSQVSIKSEPFCGKTWYSIEGKNDSANIFLINIITDTLREGVYQYPNDIGANLWTSGLSGISLDIKMNISKVSNGFEANFSGTIISMNKNYPLNNGFVIIKK